jgi:hypothetical protein
MTFVPTADQFRQRDGEGRGPPWFATSAELEVDLWVPDHEWAPDAASVAMLGEAAAQLPALLRAAEAHVLEVVDAARAGLSGAPEPVSLACNAAEGTAELELYWASDTYNLWTVTFTWRDGRGSPSAFGRRFWKAGR